MTPTRELQKLVQIKKDYAALKKDTSGKFMYKPYQIFNSHVLNTRAQEYLRELKEDTRNYRDSIKDQYEDYNKHYNRKVWENNRYYQLARYKKIRTTVSKKIHKTGVFHAYDKNDKPVISHIILPTIEMRNLALELPSAENGETILGAVKIDYDADYDVYRILVRDKETEIYLKYYGNYQDTVYVSAKKIHNIPQRLSTKVNKLFTKHPNFSTRSKYDFCVKELQRKAHYSELQDLQKIVQLPVQSYEWNMAIASLKAVE